MAAMTDRDQKYREAHKAERAAYMREYRKRKKVKPTLLGKIKRLLGGK